MTMIDTGTLYDEALRGEPLERVVFPAPLNTGTSLWTLGECALIVPPPIPRPAPEMQRIARHLMEWTGWSAHRLAEVLGTSHTTVLGIKGGRPLVDGRSGDLRRRLTDAHDVIERVYLLANRDPDTVARLLDTASAGRKTAIEEMQAGEPARAYLAAIDVLRPRAPGLLVGNRPRQGGATAPLHD